MATKHKVLIMRCNDYNPDTIRGIVREGMEELSVRPAGKVLLKPNAVIAHPQLFPHACTRKEFLEGVIAAARDKGGGITELAVGDRSGLTIPTRWTFANAGYHEVLRKHNAKAYYFDEARHVPATLKGEHRLRDRIYVPEPVAKADFLINLPKFKAHPWCRLTLSLKNYIGLQDDRHRLVDHNQFLEHKIADLQEVIQPKFIAIDAIVAGQKMMLTPTPFAMGAIVMGVNPCAVDTVGCHMVHVDPSAVVHLRLAAGRGFGPIDLGEIQVGGDFPLDEVQAKTRGFEFCMERIDRYFENSGNLSCTVGTFPEKHSRDYCWGGCPGALQEAMHIIRANSPGADHRLKKIRYVVGKVDGPLELQEGEQVIFAGDCTSWRGEIDGRPVRIESSYLPSSQVDESRTQSNDLLLRTSKALWKCFRLTKRRHMHARGCPVTIADHIHYVSALGKISNPNFDRRVAVTLNVAYWRMRAARLVTRLFA
ncbi:MAG: DUF362 domain-containing protein [Bryobacterales bacterium]|nr:DUF362 domain-containing protein [Bryobacterales bacterium]